MNWIGVKTALPADNEMVQAFSYGKYHREYLGEATYDHGTQSWIVYHKNKDILAVSHWMPLPTPPEEPFSARYMYQLIEGV